MIRAESLVLHVMRRPGQEQSHREDIVDQGQATDVRAAVAGLSCHLFLGTGSPFFLGTGPRKPFPAESRGLNSAIGWVAGGVCQLTRLLDSAPGLCPRNPLGEGRLGE